MNDRIIVCGASGYVGRRLLEYLVDLGHQNVVGVAGRLASVTPAMWQLPVEWISGNLREREFCRQVVTGARHVYNLAASVGGIGFVQTHGAECLTNVLINTHLVEESAKAGVQQYFFASSSCVYPDGIDRPLKESDAYPASPMGGYGVEKLFSEQLCQAYTYDKALLTCIARYHGIYGPLDARPTGSDHVVTALAKKVVQAKISGVHEIAIWGDGTQTRSLLYIADCVEGTCRMMQRGTRGPINLAHPEPVTVNQIVDVLEDCAAIKLTRFYQPGAPTGRRYKTSDNSALRKALNWEPETRLRDGLNAVYRELWDDAIRLS